jgi:hypothetical protein
VTITLPSPPRASHRKTQQAAQREQRQQAVAIGRHPQQHRLGPRSDCKGVREGHDLPHILQRQCIFLTRHIERDQELPVAFRLGDVPDDQGLIGSLHHARRLFPRAEDRLQQPGDIQDFREFQTAANPESAAYPLSGLHSQLRPAGFHLVRIDGNNCVHRIDRQGKRRCPT